MDFSNDRIKVLLAQLKGQIVKRKNLIDGFVYKETTYKSDNKLPSPNSTWKSINGNDLWGGEKGTHYWFYNKFKTEKETVFRLCTGMYGEGWGPGNPQFLVYLNGEMVYGMDYFHEAIEIKPETEYEIHIYAYTNDSDKKLEWKAYAEEIDEKVKKLYYDLNIPYEICQFIEEEDKRYSEILGILNEAASKIDTRIMPSEEFSASVDETIKFLEKTLYSKKDNNLPTVVCVGHSHIDVAWLWTVQQTREKVQRTFSSVVSMLKKYPEYKFMASTAQLYEFVKEDAPDLYEEIKELVKMGRWEINGAMWVEADCNLSSGESIVRQILYGKRFFKKEFDVDCDILWLPDVFGYSAALPQILRNCGVDKFVTSKISWNEENTMPHDTFWWKGIDGTEIFTYFLTAQDKIKGQKPTCYTTYTALTTPKMVAGTYERYKDKKLSDEVLLTFGYGDGGGGPTEWMIENGRRMVKGIAPCPKVKFDTAGAFLNRLKSRIEKTKNVPEWVGELYLEYHRGTYTSMAKNKKYNRDSEKLYHNAELISVINQILLNKKYPQDELYRGWKGIMINQFHDIIPGSSIKEVYDESDIVYKEVTEIGEGILNENHKYILNNVKTEGGILVFNNNSFEATDCIEVDGVSVLAENIPPMGYKVINPKASKNSVKQTDNVIENKYLRVSFKKGEIVQIYDKETKRNILPKGKIANRLVAFEDYPRDWDAWEISNYYTEKEWNVDNIESFEPIACGEKKGFKCVRKFLNSTITQKIWMYPHCRRVDFETDIDWKEDHLLLKAFFPVDVHSNKATCDIQFGNVERNTHKNTSWDEAKFEVCAHKFVDVSEDDYGVAVLNDCKYGYGIDGQEIGLSLLKCATYPNPEADKCEHSFTYSVYPHSGGFTNSDVQKQAYLLNNPMQAYKVPAKSGVLPDVFSLACCDRDNVIIETVKKAEDGKKTVLRLYEYCNRRCKAKITFGFDVKKAFLCDMLENEIQNLKISDSNTVEIEIKPYEIITLCVE